MVLVLLFWAAYLYLADRVIFHGLRLGTFILCVGILVALFLVLVFWTLHHLTKPSKQQTEAAQKFYNAVVNKDKPEQ